jgi:pimeloyl-ACP methyl ester carboxylesterase
MMGAATLRDLRMTIRFHRSGRGAPLLMLHGLGLDRHIWDGLSALSDRFELVSCDLPAVLGIEDMSEVLAAALRRDGIAKTHVVGHDLGGMVALHLAASEPAMVERLVLCATAPTFNDDDRALWRQRAAMARQAGAAAVLGLLEAEWFTPAFLARNPQSAACSPEKLAVACEALATADLIDLAGEIYARTLVLVGEHDTLAYREAADWLAQSIAGAKLAFVPHAAHAVPQEQPGWLAAVLRDFLG